jgi:branched-chain amino acid transport system substrate-binding protein
MSTFLRCSLWVSQLAFLAAGSTGCGAPKAPELTKVGVIMSLTGSLGGKGTERIEAMNLAVDAINENGGLKNGNHLELVTLNDSTDVPTGVAAANTLAEQGLPLVIGAAASSISLAVADVLIPKEIVQLSGASTSPLLTSKQDNGFLFRTCPSDALQGKLLAQRAKAQGLTKMAIIHVPGAYGSGLAQAFTDEFTKTGTITLKVEYELAKSSYQSLLSSVYASNPPQGVLLAGYAVEGAQIIRDYLDLYAASNPTSWFFSDGLAEDTFITAVGASSFTFTHEGSGGAAPAGSRYESFRKAFNDRYGRDPNPSIFSANYFDAVHLVALALSSAEPASGTALRDALASVSKGGAPYESDTYKDAIAALKRGEDVDFQGASGSVDFDAFGDVVTAYDIWKVVGGKKTTVVSSISP